MLPDRTSVLIGRIMSVIVVVALLGDSAISFFAPELIRSAAEETGFTPQLDRPLGIITLVCGLVYAWPRTAALGAILATGFFGGAICAHFRIGEMGSPPQLISLLIAAMAWGGLYLRNGAVRQILPLMRGPADALS